MSYTRDINLEFLQYCDTKDLQILVDYLTKDKDGEFRFTEELTETYNYKLCYPYHLPKMWKDIAGELQKFGGNTFVNMFRGGGVSYREILIDVASKMKVNFNKGASVDTIEKNILDSVLEKSVYEMKDEELKAFLKEFGVTNLDLARGQLTNVAIQTIRHTMIRGGFGTYKLAVIVANQVARALLGRGLAVATNYALTTWLKKVIVFSGPIGWIISGIWTALDIAAPAYRVTIPAVIQIAYMRIKHNTPKDEIKWEKEPPKSFKSSQNSVGKNNETIINTLVYKYCYEKVFLKELSYEELKDLLDVVEGRKVRGWGNNLEWVNDDTEYDISHKFNTYSKYRKEDIIDILVNDYNYEKEYVVGLSYESLKVMLEEEEGEENEISDISNNEVKQSSELSDKEILENKITELEKTLAELKQKLK